MSIQADETQESPIILADPFTWMTVASMPTWDGSDAEVLVFRGRVEEQRETRTEKGLSQPPRKLLDKFPMLISKRDSGRNYHGVLLNVDPGVLYSMPMLDQELFDQDSGSSSKRFLIDSKLLDEPWIVPEGIMRSPDGGIRIFRHIN